MKVCKRVNFIQIFDNKGTTRICGWLKDGGIIGRLADQSMKEIYHGEKMQHYLDMLSKGDYSNCRIDACPLLSNDEVNEHLVEIDKLPEYPEELYLAFEQTCNYRCTSCTVHDHLLEEQRNSCNLSEDYELIEDRLKDVLPYIKKISANGQGEVFASPHILNILTNWNPINPVEECSVDIETNGSLFNRQNWKKIENLGKYKLSVYVTVMSFDEKTYQYLSGTSLSIQNIIDNLKFMQELRKKEIINYLEIATVYQERNFRTLPEFVHKALEFDPDCIRLRPYEPWTKKDWELRWFADVRGKYHPYHQEFLEVMKNPIFKNPKVYNQGGGLDSESDNFPISRIREMAEEKCYVLTQLCTNKVFTDSLKEIIGSDSIVLDGIGDISKALVGLLEGKIEIPAILDRAKSGKHCDIDVVNPTLASEEIRKKPIMLTVMYNKDDIQEYLRERGFVGKIFDIREVIKNDIER